MKIECSIKGTKSLENSLNKLYINILKGMEDGVEKMTNNTKEKAKDLAPVDQGNRQILKNATMSKVEKNKDSIVGKVYIDKTIAPFGDFVYNGTGVRGRGSGKFSWMVTESTLKYSTPEIIGMYFKTQYLPNGERYWIVYGQKPNRYLENALFVSKNEDIDIFKNEVKKYLRRV